MEEALKRDDEFVEARLRLATAYKLTGQNDLALEELIKTAATKGAPSEVQFTLGEGYWQAGKYNEAEQAMKAYLASSPRSRSMQDAANHILQSVQFAKSQLNNPADINTEALPSPINQFPLQYFPVLTADNNTILYTRRRGNSPADDEDLVISTWDGQEWSEPVSLSDSINSQYNEGTSTVSADGRTIIFTACQGRRTYGSCDLYISYKTGSDWSRPRNLGGTINSRYWESQPSLSADGRTLYFVSDRPGGRGSTDIYVSYKNGEGNWTDPVNLGPTINTAGDEVSPFIHANGKSLYFASNGLVGMGGQDIFLSELEAGKWSTPKNLGYPINTFGDQVSLYVSADGNQGYYSVEEMTNGRLATSVLHSLNLPPYARVTAPTTYVKGKVLNAKTKEPLFAEVNLYNLATDSLVGSVKSDKIIGTYLVVLPAGSEYGLYVKQPGYLYKSLSFTVDSSRNTPTEIDILLDPIEKGASTELSNVFFDTDKYELKPASKTELQQVVTLLQENPTITIEVSGHTDNVGAKEYNQELSENRAKSVKAFLERQGINPSRIKAVGYGMAKPRASNETEKGRKINRRIEILII